jgi:hypothetical protein
MMWSMWPFLSGLRLMLENILDYIRTRAEDLGGFQNLSPMEKEIFGKASTPHSQS